MKEQYQKYKHMLLVPLYGIIYVSWFAYLEKTIVSHFHVIHMSIDNYIPFVEAFIIPYFLWFFYIAFVVVYTMFFHKQEYFKICGYLFTGMTIFLIISTLFPNGHYLRPSSFPRENIFTYMVSLLWKADTPTNLFPSIHVFNSLAAHLTITRCPNLKKRPLILYGSFLLCVSIILSTVFLKQHSIFDVITAFIMAFTLYPLVYKIDYRAIFRTKCA